VTATVAALWLITLLLAAILPANKSAGFSIRPVDIFVIVMTIAFGTAWFTGLLYKPKSATAQATTSTGRSCISVKTGQSEQKVRELLGEPDEIRNAEEVRGPGAQVWIYRDSRCAVHYLLGNVISIE
jgi:hypothetical protein